jgi:predicted small secreted protein
MKKSLSFIILLFVLFIASGCATWEGAKQDTSDGAQWSKEKVNDGAKYIEKKTD